MGTREGSGWVPGRPFAGFMVWLVEETIELLRISADRAVVLLHHREARAGLAADEEGVVAPDSVRPGIAGDLSLGEKFGMIANLPFGLPAKLAAFRGWIRRWTRPSTRPIAGYVLDRFRSRDDLVRENALRRKQREVACRQIARPRPSRAGRAVLVLLTRLVPTWRSAMLLVRPETILRWHRRAFQLLWRRRSRPTGSQRRIAAETVAPIEEDGQKQPTLGR